MSQAPDIHKRPLGGFDMGFPRKPQRVTLRGDFPPRGSWWRVLNVGQVKSVTTNVKDAFKLLFLFLVISAVLCDPQHLVLIRKV